MQEGKHVSVVWTPLFTIYSYPIIEPIIDKALNGVYLTLSQVGTSSK